MKLQGRAGLGSALVWVHTGAGGGRAVREKKVPRAKGMGGIWDGRSLGVQGGSGRGGAWWGRGGALKRVGAEHGGGGVGFNSEGRRRQIGNVGWGKDIEGLEYQAEELGLCLVTGLWDERLYWFPRTTSTKHHREGSLNHRHLFPHSSGS